MTATERFRCVAAGATPDRVPVICNLPDHGAGELRVSQQQYFAAGELVAEGQLRLRERYGYDTLLGMFYTGIDAEIFGCRHIVYAESGPPNVGEMVLRDPRDLSGLRLPEELGAHPRFREVLRCIRVLKQESAGRWPVVATVTASFSLPAMLMGMGEWMELFLNGDPKLRDSLLEICSELCTRQIAALKEAGADWICYINPIASATCITVAKFRELALPWVIRDLAAGTEGIFFFTGGGVCNPILPELKAHTVLDAFYLNPFDDLAAAREMLGPGPVIAGSINDIRLVDWSPGRIDREVARIMEAGKAAGSFIFGTLVMPLAIPEANIHALVDAALRHGSYSAGTA